MDDKTIDLREELIKALDIEDDDSQILTDELILEFSDGKGDEVE